MTLRFKFRPWWLYGAWLFVIGFCSIASSSVLSDELSREDRLKAAYLFHFTHYITWPEQQLPSGSNLVLCVEGSVEFTDFIRQMALQLPAQESDQERLHAPVVVRHLLRPDMGASQKGIKEDPLGGCHLAYVRSGVYSAVSPDTLLVSDYHAPGAKAAAILFFPQKQRLRFEIILPRVQASPVTMSSELLRLARLRDN
jgi:YfiR/HmsC-like